MKCLMYQWNSYFDEDVRDLLRDHGISMDSFTYHFGDYENDDEFLSKFGEYNESDYDFVISVNFWPLIAKGCHEKGLKYIAWCYDCPLNILNPEKAMAFPGNTIFLFDRKQFEEYQNKGIDTVHHLMLGVNKKRALNFKHDEAITTKYMTDVSLIGSLYESQLGIICSKLDNGTRAVLEEIVKVQENLYDRYIIGQVLTDGLMSVIKAPYEETGLDISRKAVEFALACEVTRKNRLVLLNLFGRRFKTKLYSFQTFEKLDGVEQCGVLDYRTELPYAAKYSKINLNPVLRITQTGIPLRAFDIMGHEGFLLSSWQEEMAEQFKDGSDLIMYKSYEEALDKASYYLSHDDERERISLSGYTKVMEKHTLEQRFDEILKISKVI